MCCLTYQTKRPRYRHLPYAMHHSSYEISETSAQNSIKIRGRKNFRCVRVSFAFLLVMFVSEEIYLSQVYTLYSCILTSVSTQSVSILARADMFEGFCQPCSWHDSSFIVSETFFLYRISAMIHGVCIHLSQGLDIDCQNNLISNLKFTPTLFLCCFSADV